ncbi:mitochondrial protein Pet127-domain-containing protein [Fomitopsis serialis]|uniref:mitochondrial protein Pet127-domain-containing protein n=1 Tax=Fomitopsis serialis TaxID=139415 RepID=UPI002008DDC6|nr:mitochondrial protein Pet127-domain-containing protein [Neoantrodia serialis]KAH9936356.1 mitochondrial protein Pet127-domain-containing protein [Neoantrodia serialis]
MLRVRYAPLKPLRHLNLITTHRTVSVATQSHASNTNVGSDGGDESAPIASGSKYRTPGHHAEDEPRVEFKDDPSEDRDTSYGPLHVKLPAPSVEPTKRTLSNKLRRRQKVKEARGPVPRLVPHARAKGTPRKQGHRVHGLLSPFDAIKLQDVPVPERKEYLQPPILQHGLARVLTNPGVHWLTEPRTKVDNFPSYLKEMPSTSEFAFERLKGFVPSSRDNDLLSLAKKHNCRFAGSTSSLTGMLSQIYLLLCENKPVDLSSLSAHYQREANTFTPGQRMPISVSLRYKNGVYATDSDADHLAQLGSTETILSQLGLVMERFFTTFHETSPTPLIKRSQEEVYRYAIHNNFMMRAQLDCYSPVLPGTGVFDIKTRAAVPIRYDLERYRDNSDYQIRSIQGSWMSFEKEYYDLIRSAFLKYSFQARIGAMDGVFVAYHNIREIFGFQYIPLEEMDMRLFGHTHGDRVFSKCVGLLEILFTEIVTHFPNKSVNCTWETVSDASVMRIWIEPAEWKKGGEKPVVQLDVRVQHYLGGTKISGAEAVASKRGGWTVSYSVRKSTLPQEQILKLRRAAFDTQLSLFKFNLSITERLERREDIDLSHLDPLASVPKVDALAGAEVKVGPGSGTQRRAESVPDESSS